MMTRDAVDRFMDETARDLSARLRLLHDCGERRALEDGIALLTDFRLSGMDAQRFERLLASLRSGRSPVGLSVLKPEEIGRELTQRWSAYTGSVSAAALR
jgi:hypothetical protein